MLFLVLVSVIIFLLLCISEFLWHRKRVHPEYTRKFVHISVGSFVAFWPFFLSRQEIIGLSIAFIVVVGIAHYGNFFHAIRSVQRPTWGEAFFAVAVGALAYLAPDKWIYMVALLHMSLADGLAAVVGTRFGKRTTYHVLGYAKSIVGTLTFFCASLGIFAIYVIGAHAAVTPWFACIIIGATILENIAVRGLDNLLVPAWIAIGLGLLH